MIRVLLLLLVFISPAIASEQIAGVASVIDGDTIDIHGARIRMHGIDAPESAQTCKRGGVEYRCGKEAAFALADKIGRKPVVCEQRDTDRYHRIVAVCNLNGLDLNRWLVRQGYAVAYREYSIDYVADEEAAKAEQAGIWAGEFENPAEFRKHGTSRYTSPDRSAPAASHIEPATVAPSADTASGNGLSDSDVARILIQQSHAGYSGSCPCPDNVDRAGRRCGKRSAYSRPGGASTLCYASDVTPAMIASYRKLH